MNCLIIGLGSIAKKHIHVLNTYYPDIHIFALRSQADSPAYNGVTNLYSWEAVEARKKDWDFALVCSPTHLHAETLERMKDWDCALFIEKPLFAQADETLESLVVYLQQQTRLTYIACNLRFLDCLKFVKTQLETSSSLVQEVNSYCGSYLPDWRPQQDFRKVYSANKAMGGGVHLDLIHELDYLYWLFGLPQKSYALLRNTSILNIDAVDSAHYWLEYHGFVADVTLNYFRRDAKRSVEIVLEDKTLSVNLIANTVHQNGTLCFASQQKVLDTYTEQMHYFVNLLKNKQIKSFNNISEGWKVLQICLKSNETKR